MREPLNLLFLFLAVWLACAVEHGFSYGAPLENKYPLGTIGCLFTDNLCQIDEECVDDLLFGNCQQNNNVKDYYQYRLSRKALESLEKHIRRLIKGDYSWRDAYTQCVLQNALLFYRQQKSIEMDTCRDLKITDDSWTDGVNQDLSEVLEKVLDGYYAPYEDPSIEENNLGISDSNKRDEIIHVHKYFDKSMEPHSKRQYDSAGSNALLDDQNYLHYLPEYSSPYRKRTKMTDDISLEDIQMLQYYLQSLRNSPDQDVVPDLDLNYNLPYMPLADTNFDHQASENSNYIPSDNNMWIDLAPSEEEKTGDDKLGWTEGEESKDSVDVSDSLTPEYANLLGKLMQDKIQAKSLTDEELSFLSKYVNKRLQQLGYTPEEIALIGKDTNQDSEKSEGTENEKAGDALTNLAASLDEASNPSQDNNGGEKVLMFDESDMGSQMDADKKTIGFPVAGELFEPESKKSSEDPDKGDNQSQKDFVNVDYAFVDFSEDRDTAQTRIDKFIEKLRELTGTKILNPFDDFKLSSTPTGGSKLTFEVLPESGLNASQVTDVAEKYKNDLADYSQLTVVDTGLGQKENQVSSKRHDNRYFELTFVLCGCIAGILLAVVVIYLIRRHSRSKEKLARLATTGEGTEASKDYQDLCRQRMQSKSSEKPEPLHAASRIGSVSETQVRSPSSRSSTSSWSEEPVSNNMDISTGHIVLSYMEDHLKNKDRLDREWENLCSYEADPSSTKVASDAANMRKNRYSDILPYDHSRVILSNTNNVSSSDYINASTITDHDPRNPAYITTQGPLPHTIADFWQMVWEQGSVVIVMLTKLTENGEAMCHRYWPEEGSDLYHTYEVNLVSEHVWCDDYLVRSFYLKNVQTAETRTVTQFHFLTWQDLGVPSSSKALLDFRRKVNKSYRGRSCPIVVHCSDGCGRTGTYALIDMVLNRMAKGAKEIDIAATLEHIRDQRMNMVKTKEQFQFALAAVAEEVHAILKALPQ